MISGICIVGLRPRHHDRNNTDENELLLGIIYYDHGIVCNVTAGTFYPVAKRPYTKMTYSPEVDTTKRMSFNNLCRVGRLQSAIAHRESNHAL